MSKNERKNEQTSPSLVSQRNAANDPPDLVARTASNERQQFRSRSLEPLHTKIQIKNQNSNKIKQ